MGGRSRRAGPAVEDRLGWLPVKLCEQAEKIRLLRERNAELETANRYLKRQVDLLKRQGGK